MKYNWLL